MKERSISFSAPMVRALLAGGKTQTRRIIKDQPADSWCPVVGPYHPIKIDRHGQEHPGNEIFGASDENYGRVSPYGCPDDRIWVREAWRTYASLDHLPPRSIAPGAGIQYEAGGASLAGKDKLEGMGRFRPSMFMPRWASRVTLEIASIRAERLNDCSEADAAAEGVAEWARGACATGNPLNYSDVQYYELLWNQINGAGSWNANPWVWVVEFKRIEVK